MKRKKTAQASNILDFSQALKKKQQEQHKQSQKSKKKTAQLITHFHKLRQAQIQANRRQVRRTLLEGFIGACAVVPSKGLVNVSVHDISKTGLSFDMPVTQGAFASGESLCMRIYMNHETYFPFEVTIQNTRPLIGTDCNRFGARFNPEAFNTLSLRHFVDFIESVTACLKTDKGDTMVSLR